MQAQALISPRFASAVMRSAARKASASMVIVGWPRPEVTRLLPSQRKRFLTSCARWSGLITDVFGSFPMRQVPRRWKANFDSAAGKPQCFFASAAEGDFLQIEFVAVLEHSTQRTTLVVVERVLELTEDNSITVEHQIFAHDPAGIREAVGKLFVGRKQEQARSFRAIGADHYSLGLLQMRVALLIEANDASRAPIGIRFDAMDIRIGTNFAAARLLRYSNDRSQGARFGADFAPEAKTEAAIDASASSRARLRINRHRRGEWMPPQLPPGAFENHALALHRQRRHRIGLRSRRIERAGAGPSGDAHLPFHFRVARFEIRVGHRPRHPAATPRPARLASSP